MQRINFWISSFTLSLAVSAAQGIAQVSSVQAASLVNSILIPGNATDLAPLNGGSSSVNTNRLGGFGSDLYYDRTNNVYYGLTDRGPGGGLIPYQTRVEKFSLDVNPVSGAISNFKLLSTILFTQNGANFNGLNPGLLNGNKATLGRSQDPEGFAIAPNGNFYVSDEYGPSVYEYKPNGEFVRAFSTPANILSKAADGTPNFVDGRPTITSGRQDNRGFEGLAMSPDGTKLFAMLQDPLVNEGTNGDGRNSPNLRIVVFDTATGNSTAQYIYPLESLADINNRIPGTASDFAATAQGRNIGISAITAINDKEFLVLERDNRGVGIDDPTGTNPVGSKRVYKIDITGATDVSGIPLTNTLPAGVVPVTKNSTPFIDIAAALRAAGLPIPEKFEGLTIGPKLTDGSYLMLLATDNDFSVTQTGSGTQLDVCSDGAQVALQVVLDTPCPTGTTLLPSYLFAFKLSPNELAGFVPAEAVPEPASVGGLALFGMGSAWLKRKRDRASQG